MVPDRGQIRFAAVLAAIALTLPAWAQEPAPGGQQSPPPQDTDPQASASTQGADAQTPLMRGWLGDYAATLDASGTSWQPRSTPMEGIRFAASRWSFMLHGFATFAYGAESGPRGESEFLAPNMFMLRGSRPLGSGALGVSVMSSLEPSMGPEGYALLLQTGETADGVNPLIDRQHPHDLFMELALVYNLPIAEDEGLFFYFAPVGEPPIGPPNFMHRFSSGDNPQSPISHHMLDSTHITYGVATIGFVHADTVKLELSLFTGREPDENRWGIEAPKLDSIGARMTINPTPDLAFQASFADLTEPEEIHAGIDATRITASAMYNRSLGESNWQTTVAFGRNHRKADVRTEPPPAEAAASENFSAESLTPDVVFRPEHFNIDPDNPDLLVLPGTSQYAFLVESAYQHDGAHTLFGRYDLTVKDELFGIDDPRHSDNFTVSKLTLGYIWDALHLDHAKLGLGVSGAVNFVPDALVPEYGDNPASVLGFLRIRLR